MDTINHDDINDLDIICASDMMISTQQYDNNTNQSNAIRSTNNNKHNNHAEAVHDRQYYPETRDNINNPSFSQVLYDYDYPSFIDQQDMNSDTLYHPNDKYRQMHNNDTANDSSFSFTTSASRTDPTVTERLLPSLSSYGHQYHQPLNNSISTDSAEQYYNSSTSISSALSIPTTPSRIFSSTNDNSYDISTPMFSDTQLDMLFISSQSAQQLHNETQEDEAYHVNPFISPDHDEDIPNVDSIWESNKRSNVTASKRTVTNIEDEDENISIDIDDNIMNTENQQFDMDDNDDFFQDQLGTQTQPRETVVAEIEQTIYSLIQRIVLEKPPLGFPGFVASPAQQQPSITERRKRQRRNNTHTETSNTTETGNINVNNITDGISEEQVNTEAGSGNGGRNVTATRRAPIQRVDSAKSVKSFARRLKVLEIIHESIVNNVFVSKRDIYYRDVTLFENQPTVDRIITGWSQYFNVPRSCLNVTASSKGLIYGAAYITLKNNKSLDCTADVNSDDSYCSDEHGVSIPPINQIANVVSVADFVLVVEKESSFRQLVSAGFAKAFPNCILITGRGYPDIATQHLTKYLATQYRKLPIFAFVDYDPYGLEIYAIYKWGSRTHAFDAPNLAVPTIQLLGLSKKDRLSFHIPSDSFAPLTQRDRNRALNMILNEHPSCVGHVASSSYKSFLTEVSQMLHLNFKCELQALCTDNSFGMIRYLRTKISDQLLQQQ